MAKKTNGERQQVDDTGIAAIVDDYKARDKAAAQRRMTPAERARAERVIERTSITLRLNADVAEALAEYAQGLGISKASAADMLIHYALLHLDDLDPGDYLEESRSSRWLWRVRAPAAGLLDLVRRALGERDS